MQKLTILIINRWDDEMACYEKYIDHDQYDVAYLTNARGINKIRTDLAKDIYVTDYLDYLFLDTQVEMFFLKNLPFYRIIAFSEVDQELAASLRSKYSVTGMNKEEVKKFRNKVEMKRVAQCALIKVPWFQDLCEQNDGDGPCVSNKMSWPLILKPKGGVSSEGVYKAHTMDEFQELLSQIDNANYECEQFIEGTIYHADGLIYNGSMLVFKVSEYINTCFEYTQGAPLGSVIIDDAEYIERARQFTQQVIGAFSLINGAFHLEFIRDDHDDFYFLEIGARIGGAQVPHVFKSVYNIDLFQIWVDIQLGNKISLNKYSMDGNHVGGWLLFPQPKNVPCKVECSRSLKEHMPFILSEQLPYTGHVFYGRGEYRDVSGIYLYRAPSTDAIKEAIAQTINQFFIMTKPIEMEKYYDLNIVKR